MIDTPATEFTILQYNVRKDREGTMHELLRNQEVLGYHVLAIQEPWLNRYQSTTHNPNRQYMELLWPTETAETGQPDPTRVCFFINQSIPKDSVEYVNHLPTLQTLNIRISAAGDRWLSIHNCYLLPEGQDSSVPSAAETLRALDTAIGMFGNHEHLVVGDFNAKHTDWGGDDVERNQGPHLAIRQLTNKYNLQLLLPVGTITRPADRVTVDRGSTIDLTWGSQQISDGLIECDVPAHLEFSSDHLPIRTRIGFYTQPRPPRQPVFNMRKTVKEQYQTHLASMIPPEIYIGTQLQLEQAAETITDALLKAIRKSTPYG